MDLGFKPSFQVIDMDHLYQERWDAMVAKHFGLTIIPDPSCAVDEARVIDHNTGTMQVFQIKLKEQHAP